MLFPFHSGPFAYGICSHTLKGRGLYNLGLTWPHYILFINATKVKVLYWKKSNICCCVIFLGKAIVIRPWTLISFVSLKSLSS